MKRPDLRVEIQIDDDGFNDADAALLAHWQSCAQCRRSSFDLCATGIELRDRAVAAMTVVCAWCSAVMRGTLPAAQVSHGICPACEAKQG